MTSSFITKLLADSGRAVVEDALKKATSWEIGSAGPTGTDLKAQMTRRMLEDAAEQGFEGKHLAVLEGCNYTQAYGVGLVNNYNVHRVMEDCHMVSGSSVKDGGWPQAYCGIIVDSPKVLQGLKDDFSRRAELAKSLVIKSRMLPR